MDSPIISRENWKAETKTEASWFGPFSIVSMKHSDASPSYLVCDSEKGLAQKTAGFLVFEFPASSNARFKSESITFFSSFEQEAKKEVMERRYLQIYLIHEDSTLVKSDIEAFVEQHKARKYFLSDQDRWFNKFIVPRDHAIEVEHFKLFPTTQNKFPIAVRLTSEGKDVIHFANKVTIARTGEFAHEDVVVIEAFAENGWLAFGHPKTSPDPPEAKRPIDPAKPQMTKDRWTK